MMIKQHQFKPQQRGVSLVEVLVAILIVSFGVLGLVGLQARATQFSLGAEERNRAALVANEIGSQLVMSNVPDLPTAELAAWNARISGAGGASGVVDPFYLPNGAASAATTGRTTRITITWQSPGASGPPNSYVTDVTIP
jgi:type IV pilus assembly protein PilV